MSRGKEEWKRERLQSGTSPGRLQKPWNKTLHCCHTENPHPMYEYRGKCCKIDNFTSLWIMFLSSIHWWWATPQSQDNNSIPRSSVSGKMQPWCCAGGWCSKTRFMLCQPGHVYSHLQSHSCETQQAPASLCVMQLVYVSYCELPPQQCAGLALVRTWREAEDHQKMLFTHGYKMPWTESVAAQPRDIVTKWKQVISL